MTNDQQKLIQFIDGLRRRYVSTGSTGRTEPVVEIVMEGNVVIELNHHQGIRSHPNGLVVQDWGAEKLSMEPMTVIFVEKICAIRGREKWIPFK